MAAVTRDALIGRWTHSYEDDTADMRIYRPSSHAFPPARGRASFELAADGTMVEHGIGPTDRSIAENGRWELDGDRLVLRSGARRAARVLQVVSVSADRLVVKQ